MAYRRVSNSSSPLVPDVAVRFAERVLAEVRRVLNIHIYGVAEDGTVTYVGDRPDPAA